MIRSDERPPLTGKGTFVHSNSFFTYTGDWKDGVKHGNGVFIMRDGSSYEGQFKNGEIIGNGVKRWPDGSTYSGQFQDGEMNGEGFYIGSNGEKYTGTHVNNRREGKGELQTKDGSIFCGSFLRHKPHGDVVKTFTNGASISATFENGEIVAGNGHWIYPNNIEYDGEISAVDGHRHGNGVFTDHNTNIVYHGAWSDDSRDEIPTNICAVFVENAHDVVDLTNYVDESIAKRKIVTQIALKEETVSESEDESVDNEEPTSPKPERRADIASELFLRAFLTIPEEHEKVVR